MKMWHRSNESRRDPFKVAIPFAMAIPFAVAIPFAIAIPFAQEPSL